MARSAKEKDRGGKECSSKSGAAKRRCSQYFRAATIVAGFALKDVETITKGIDDAIIEPARKHLIPGYDSVKQNAISAGALQSQ